MKSEYTIPAIVIEWADHEEKTSGRRPSETSMLIADLVYQLSLQIKDRGHQDKLSGRAPLPFSSFEAISRSIIACTTAQAAKLSNVTAELLHKNYMEGYSVP